MNYIQIDEETGLMNDRGLTLTLYTEGYTLEEMLENAYIYEVNGDGTDIRFEPLDNYGAEVWAVVERIIEEALEKETQPDEQEEGLR